MRLRRKFRFSILKLFLAVTLVTTALGLAPAIWQMRPMAPRRIDVLGSGQLELPSTTIAFPVRRDSVEGFYICDGGTFGVKFTDANDNRHIISSWQPFGEPEHCGEIIVGGGTPSSGGTNIGKVDVGECLIYSLLELELENFKDQEQNTVIHMVYPRISDYAALALRRGKRYWRGLY